MMKRRGFLKTGLSLAALSTLPEKSLASSARWAHETLHDDLPIQNLTTSQQVSSSVYNGDNMDRPHDLLWDVEGYLRGKDIANAPTEDLDVVIVGGGIAGLSSAYYLRDKKFALLEQDSRMGGNAKGESYNGATYSIGSAYLCAPSENSNLGHLLSDLNIRSHARTELANETSVFFDKKFSKHFWSGVTASEHPQFKKVHQRLQDMAQSQSFEYDTRFALDTDNMSAEEWFQKEFGDLHPHIKEYFQLYGWSSFCGSIDELSAFQFLGFMTAETGDLIAFPGGNSYVAQKMVQKIRSENSANKLRSGCLVLKVVQTSGGVQVIYEDTFGTLRVILAKHAVIACPKYVARSILPNMSPEQSKAIQFLPYRPYLVGNLILNKSIQSPSFELYCLTGQAPASPTPMKPGDHGFSDICFGSWAQNDGTKNGVLTMYQGIPYDARQFLSSPNSHEKYKARYLKSVEPILNSLGLTNNDIEAIRMTRWGHALPLAAKGLVADGTYKIISQSIGEVIHFANQDNYMNPCFETSLQTAIEVASHLRTKI